MKRSFKICRIIIPGIVGGIFLFLYFLSVKQISEFENSLIEKNKMLAALMVEYIKKSYGEEELIEKISHRILPEDVLSWQIMGDDGKIKFVEGKERIVPLLGTYLPGKVGGEKELSVFLDPEKNYGVIRMPFEVEKERLFFILIFSIDAISRFKKEVVVSLLTELFLLAAICGIFFYSLKRKQRSPSGKFLYPGISPSGVPGAGRKGSDGTFLNFDKILEGFKHVDFAREYFGRIVEGIADALLVVDKNGKIKMGNETASYLTGYTKGELSTMEIDRIFPEGEIFNKRNLKKLVSSEKIVRKESYLRKKDGKKIPVFVSLSFLKDNIGRPIYAIFTLKNITHQKEREKQLLFLATHDYLTGLPNRFLFNDRLKLALDQAKRNKRKLALMILDIDNFKDVNDNFGHSVGDELLNAVGERIKGVLRRTDTVARMGGDEFLVLLPDIKDSQSAEKVARKILEEGKKPFFLGKRKIEVSFSIGISIYPEDGEDVDKLVASADIALFMVKKKGKSNFARYTSVVEELTCG